MADTYYDQYGKKYEQDLKKQLGDDYEPAYIGSAFHRRINTKKEIDAEFLRKKMPRKSDPVQTKHMDVIEAMCVKAMEKAADNNKYSVTFTINSIIPGLPPIDTKAATRELFNRIIKRPGILAYADPNIDSTLVISWAHSSGL